MYLKDEELNNIEGGGLIIGLGKWIVAGGIFTFLIGSINGQIKLK